MNLVPMTLSTLGGGEMETNFQIAKQQVVAALEAGKAGPHKITCEVIIDTDKTGFVSVATKVKTSIPPDETLGLVEMRGGDLLINPVGDNARCPELDLGAEHFPLPATR